MKFFFDAEPRLSRILSFIVPRAHQGSRRPDAILLVEDDLDEVARNVRALRRNGVLADIIVATDGDEAVDWLFACGAHSCRDEALEPCLMLVDLEGGSRKLMDRVRAHRRTSLLPVIVLSNASPETDVAHSGPTAYVAKPLDFRALTDASTRLRVALHVGDDGSTTRI